MVARGSPTLQMYGICKAKVEGSSPLFLVFLLLAHVNHVLPLRKSLSNFISWTVPEGNAEGKAYAMQVAPG